MAPTLYACPQQGMPAIVAEILKHERDNILFSAVNYSPLAASLLMRGPSSRTSPPYGLNQNNLI
jgi:hypothetical protein